MAPVVIAQQMFVKASNVEVDTNLSECLSDDIMSERNENTGKTSTYGSIFFTL
jgi:hypothetical protein